MKTTILAILRADAEAWWYHRQLREQGQLAEAAQLERGSIRGSLRSLREAVKSGGFLAIGRGGPTLHTSAHCKVQGYVADKGVFGAAALLVPVVDTRTVPDSKLGALISLPMAQVGCTERDRFGPEDQEIANMLFPAYVAALHGATGVPGALDYVPPAMYAAMAAELGATVSGWEG